MPPKAGKWSTLRAFLREVICDNDPQTFEYLIQYLAHLLQKPEEKPGIMIVLLGQQGTGKGAFFTLLRKIWGGTTLLVSNVEQVLGQFNAALERHYAVCMDEALFAGDKKAMEQLKSLITEPKCRIEQKYQPSRTIDSFHRFFAASNNAHFAHVDRDDRRFLFLRVSSARQGDSHYFKHLFQAIENGADVGAMVHELMQLDLQSFNVRLRPKTKEHLSQKIQSLSGFDRFWYETLQHGVFPGDYYHSSSGWELGRFIATKDLIKSYKSFDKNAERYHTIQSQTVADKLGKLCPSAKKSRSTSNGDQERGYDLPHIDLARNDFDKAMGGGMDWGWDTPKSTSPTPVFPDWELEAMRETYDMDDGSVGPEDDEVF